MRVPLLALGCALALTGAGCGDDDGEETAPPTTTTEVPDVTDMPRLAAIKKLNNSKLSARPEFDDSGYPSGTIFQQDPEPGSEVDEGSVVTITVSTGPRPEPKPEPKPKPKPEPKPAETEKSGGWTGLLANTYDVAKEVCGSFPVSKAARDLGLPASADEFAVAEKYSKGSTPEHQQPAFEGCLAGFGIP